VETTDTDGITTPWFVPRFPATGRHASGTNRCRWNQPTPVEPTDTGGITRHWWNHRWKQPVETTDTGEQLTLVKPADTGGTSRHRWNQPTPVEPTNTGGINRHWWNHRWNDRYRWDHYPPGSFHDSRPRVDTLVGPTGTGGTNRHRWNQPTPVGSPDTGGITGGNNRYRRDHYPPGSFHDSRPRVDTLVEPTGTGGTNRHRWNQPTPVESLFAWFTL